ncbi:monooxygenase [Nocardioides plantarum]|uniref:Spheroidene monooxygenase n=1 Tax=Nocardioides plantarum TaxID=29299 RepID=A0ABV5KB66_9ACTN|nr:monooxygenase [Nocardioides plantarum]
MSTVVDLRVWDVDRVAPAVLRMATGRRHLAGRPGLRFAKLLGTGAGRTFTPRDADPHRWALLTVWDDEASADAGPDPRLTDPWDEAASERLSVRMTPLSSRGRWSGAEPFGASTDEPPDHAGPVAVITRARLRTSRAASFWRAVPPVVGDLAQAPGLRLALGVGEAPVLLQGTFSIWESRRHLVDFAYRTAAHREAVARTEPARWYAEELFARFAVRDVSGTYRGRRP